MWTEHTSGMSSCRHKWLKIQSSIRYYTTLWCTLDGDFTTYDTCPMLFSNSALRDFESFDWWAWAPFLSAFCLSMIAANELKNGSCILPGSISAESEVLRVGKMNQAQRLARFLKMEKLIGCGITTRKCQLLVGSLPPPRHTQAYMHETENDTLISIFWRNTFIMGLIV